MVGGTFVILAIIAKCHPMYCPNFCDQKSIAQCVRMHDRFVELATIAGERSCFYKIDQEQDCRCGRACRFSIS